MMYSFYQTVNSRVLASSKTERRVQEWGYLFSLKSYFFRSLRKDHSKTSDHTWDSNVLAEKVENESRECSFNLGQDGTSLLGLFINLFQLLSTGHFY